MKGSLMDPILPDPEDIIPGAIDSGQHVGCMAEGCGGMAAVIWVDKTHPWLSVLCAEHSRESLPSARVIANPVFFEGCPTEVRQSAETRAVVLWRHHLDEEVDP